MYLTTTMGGKVLAGVSIRPYTLAQLVVTLVPYCGVCCSLEAQARGAGAVCGIESGPRKGWCP